MKDNARAMLLASFAADSLALGAHWIYDTRLIDQTFGRVEHLIKPLETSYHPTKNRGDFTHYGDQTLCLLESIALRGDFDLDHFARHWQRLFADYTGYLDGATKATLANFAAGKGPAGSGSGSTELGGAARIGPLVYRYRDDMERMVASARAQTVLTHHTSQVVDSAEFFARVVWRVLQGGAPIQAIEQVVDESFDRSPFVEWVGAGLSSSGRKTRGVIADFGQMCDTGAAFPAVVHLVAKYPEQLGEALVENVMAGGDSAARGLVVGMILGAHVGFAGIPEDWIADLRRHDRILDLIAKIDADAR